MPSLLWQNFEVWFSHLLLLNIFLLFQFHTHPYHHTLHLQLAIWQAFEFDYVTHRPPWKTNSPCKSDDNCAVYNNDNTENSEHNRCWQEWVSHSSFVKDGKMYQKLSPITNSPCKSDDNCAMYSLLLIRPLWKYTLPPLYSQSSWG